MIRNYLGLFFLLVSYSVYSQTPLIITTYAGNGIGFGGGLGIYSGDGGPATAAGLCQTFSVTKDRYGNIYIADGFDNRVRKVNTSGIINTFAGTGTVGFAGDGGPASAALFNSPRGLAYDTAGNIYIGDYHNYRIRKINTAGIITTIAGNGSGVYSGDGGPATNAGISVTYISSDPAGNVYFSDSNCIRKVDHVTGIITRVAGNGMLAGFSGDGGPATVAQLDSPRGTCVDAAGNLYIADVANYRIRKVNPAGIITTFAGTGMWGGGGDGGPATLATFAGPWAVAVDISGNMYIDDNGNSVIRKVDTTGIITRFAGNGTQGFSGDGCAATAAELFLPYAIYADSAGIVYIADFDNIRIRRVGPDHPPRFTGGTNQYIPVCENTVLSMNTALAIIDSDGGQSETWVLLSAPLHGTAVVAYAAVSDGDTVTPTGLHYTPAPGYSGSDSFKVRVYDCVNMADTTIVHINVLHVPPITGDTVLCAGGTSALNDSTTGGIWSSGNTAIATVGSGSGIVTGVAGGITHITYVTPAGCVAITTVTINLLANAGSITGPSVVCTGVSITLTETVTGGVWGSNGGHATVSGGVVTGTSPGIDTITYTVTNGCGPAVARHIITVNTIPPVPGAISGPSTVCTGAIISLTESVSGGIWSSSNPSVATVGSASGIVAGITTGVITISYSITNSCGTATALHIVTVNTLPVPGLITGTPVVCIGATITLADTPAGGVWSSSNGHATVGAGGIVTGSSVGTDTIFYALTDMCGTVKASKAVTVITLPGAGVITGDFTIHLCIGSTIHLADTTGIGVWSASNSRATVSGGIVTGLAMGMDTIFYTVTNICGTGIASHTVTINPTPVAGVISGPSVVCPGATISLTDTVPLFGASGVWSSVDTSVARVSSTGLVTGNTAGIDTVIYTVADTSCFAIALHIITVNPLPNPGTITGPGQVCVGSSVTLSDTAIGGTWSATNHTASLLGNIVTGVTAGIDTIQYSVTNSCGTGIVPLVITVNPLPDAGVISGPAKVCVGNGITLTETAAGGVWSSAAPGVATTDNIGDIFGISPGIDTVFFTVTSSANCTSIASYIITVYALPSAGVISGPDSVCIGGSISLTENVVDGIWSSNNTAVAEVGSTNGIVTAINTGNTLINYTVTINGCSSTAEYAITILSKPDFTVLDSITPLKCYGDASGSISVSITGGMPPFQYNWSNGNNGALISGLASGNYTLTVKEIATQCTQVNTYNIPTPDSLSITAEIKQSDCNTNTGSITASAAGGVSPYQYQWSNNATGQEINGLPSGTYTLKLTDNNGCEKTFTGIVNDSCGGIKIHDAISPNADGINDTWIIEGLQPYPENSVQVFDKWGDEVFAATNYKNDWGATGKNGLLPDGTYYYLVKLNSGNAPGGKDNFTGALLIKR